MEDENFFDENIDKKDLNGNNKIVKIKWRGKKFKICYRKWGFS